MPSKRFRVGLAGLQPGRSWAARAHIPALRALSDDFEIAGVANTSLASAEVAAKVSGIARAFANVAELVASPDVDIVAVTVKVPHHLEIVKTALGAGKHVYCEWPLGNGLAEAEEMAALAKAKGLVGVVGTQARVAPEVEYLRKLINDGFVGEVLSTTLTAWGRGWGAAIDSKATGAYLLDRANGATMMTIPLGHTLAALRDVLGDVADVSSVLTTRRKSVLARDTGEMLPMTAPDQVLVSGTLKSGAPLSIHYRCGEVRGAVGLVWEINGTGGDIRGTASSGHAHRWRSFRLRAAAARSKSCARRRRRRPTALAGPRDPSSAMSRASMPGWRQTFAMGHIPRQDSMTRSQSIGSSRRSKIPRHRTAACPSDSLAAITLPFPLQR
jgi:predicted dehydrogenase